MDNNPSNTQFPQDPSPNMDTQQPIQDVGTQQPIQNTSTQNANIKQSAPNPSNNTLSVKSIILTAINSLGGICFFLPWAVSKYSSISANASDFKEDYRYLGYTALILFTVAATIAAMKITGKLNLVSKICISAISGLAAVLALTLTIILANILDGAGSPGFGAFLSIILGAASAAVTWIPIRGE